MSAAESSHGTSRDKSLRITRSEPGWLTAAAARQLSKAISTSYCLVLIALYIAFNISKASSSYSKHQYMKPSVFLCYLYLISNVYVLLLLFFFSRPSRSKANERSHGSAFLRQGAVVFGLGTILYASLDFFSSILREREGCHYYFHSVNTFLFMMFAALQMAFVIRFPRLNLRLERGLSHLGLMHLVATNIIVWIRTIYKESIIEFHEVAEEEAAEADHSHEQSGEEHHGRRAIRSLHSTIHGMGSLTNKSAILRITSEHIKKSGEECLLRHSNDPLNHFIEASTPILFPFIIEFALIGATVFFNTFRHVDHPEDSGLETYMYKPNFKAYVKSLDWSYSAAGAIFGSIIFIVNIINLSLFFSYASAATQIDEVISKSVNTAINAVTVAARLEGVVKIQFLKDQADLSGGVNSFLLLLSGFFFLIYSSLEVIVGVLEEPSAGSVDSSLQICNGLFSIAACTAQIIFMSLAMKKALHPEEEEGGHEDKGAEAVPGLQLEDTRVGRAMEKYKRRLGGMPGRQETVFLFLLNLSQWLVFTFELQKSRASRSEAEFFGKYTWVLLQRILFPLCVFFRFHCAVIMIETWKESYRKPEL